jgi:hypothetical protein
MASCSQTTATDLAGPEISAILTEFPLVFSRSGQTPRILHQLGRDRVLSRSCPIQYTPIVIPFDATDPYTLLTDEAVRENRQNSGTAAGILQWTDGHRSLSCAVILVYFYRCKKNTSNLALCSEDNRPSVRSLRPGAAVIPHLLLYVRCADLAGVTAMCHRAYHTSCRQHLCSTISLVWRF